MSILRCGESPCWICSKMFYCPTVESDFQILHNELIDCELKPKKSGDLREYYKVIRCPDFVADNDFFDGKKSLIHDSIDENVDNLVVGIVINAIRDYKYACKNLKAHPEHKRRNEWLRMKRECVTFIKDIFGDKANSVLNQIRKLEKRI